MRKAAALILALALALCAAGGLAENDSPVFKALEGLEWSFSSGVGAWSTDLRILPDGSFSGEYHDSEMGESADEYPYGTIYGCSFTGQLAVVEQAGENAWTLRVEALRTDEGQVPEAIDDGIRYVTVPPYGVSEGDEMRLYGPGTPVAALPEDLRFWTHVQDLEDPPAALDTWFLTSEKNESGFIAYRSESNFAIANPWEDLTAEALKEASGLSFVVPEGAENVIWRYLRSEGLAEMQFTIDGDEFCARILPVRPAEGEWPDISGMYFQWDHEEPVTIAGCPGKICLAQTGSEDWVELCQWYDAAPGLMYSLSVSTTDPDGLDLTAVAGQICPDAQGND